MNFVGKVIFLALLSATLAGCKPLKKIYNETFYMGTVVGVSNCIEITGNSLISEETTRRSCAEKFRKLITEYDAASGNGAANKAADKVSFRGRLENKTQDQVITLVVLVYETYDKEGTRKTYTARTTLWLEPKSSTDFTAVLEGLEPEDFSKQEGCSAVEDTKRNCWLWFIRSLEGVALS